MGGGSDDGDGHSVSISNGTQKLFVASFIKSVTMFMLYLPSSGRQCLYSNQFAVLTIELTIETWRLVESIQDYPNIFGAVFFAVWWCVFLMVFDPFLWPCGYEWTCAGTCSGRRSKRYTEYIYQYQGIGIIVDVVTHHFVYFRSTCPPKFEKLLRLRNVGFVSINGRTSRWTPISGPI